MHRSMTFYVIRVCLRMLKKRKLTINHKIFWGTSEGPPGISWFNPHEHMADISIYNYWKMARCHGYKLYY